jgi:uncharacterized lipoprotein YddW (UPF0748 family)
MTRQLLLSLYLLFSGLVLRAQPMPSPKYEVRAVWLTTIGGLDWPHRYARTATGIAHQQEELRHLLDRYQQAGINTVLIQTRIRATTIYPSQYEPWDGCLSGDPGRSPGYDALQFAIDECHRRGMELHAWVVTLPVGKWNGKGCTDLRRKLPGDIRRIGPDGYMNPEDPRTASYLADICEEITRRYDIDGIHLDYIRYPETWPIRVSRDEGRRNITRIVEAIHRRVKQLKPWVKMSCSPIGKFDDLSRYWSHGWNAYTKVCQDAQGWLRTGLMDQLYPMMYFRGDQFFPFAIDWAEQRYGRTVAPGLGIYFLDPHEGNWRLDDITRELHVLRQYHLGQTYFRGKFLTDNSQGIYDFVSRFNATPALVPPMTWEHAPRPASPSAFTLSAGGIGWHGTAPYYNIYSSRTYPVNTDDPANLVAVRLAATSLALPTDGRYFAVTAMDRFGNESTPLQSHSRPQTDAPAAELLGCDGTTLRLPTQARDLDTDLLTIETLQGSTIATRINRGPTLNIASLPEGTYVLRSLGKKNVSHRLGFFKVDRRKH